MTPIERKFTELKEKQEKALVGFVSAGDPDIDRSYDLLCAMIESGLDVLELGIPFSDPTADGPVIQRSSMRALQNGVTISKVLDMTQRLKASYDIPIILFTYYNLIYRFPSADFYERSVEAGADGVLVVDLPVEESDELTCHFQNRDFCLIHLIAPTTDENRMKMIAGKGSGFLYLISMTGVTGGKGLETRLTEQKANMLKKHTRLPVCTGFGISTPEHVRKVSAFSDGVVIGSAFEKTIEEHAESADLADLIAGQTVSFKQATRKSG